MRHTSLPSSLNLKWHQISLRVFFATLIFVITGCEDASENSLTPNYKRAKDVQVIINEFMFQHNYLLVENNNSLQFDQKQNMQMTFDDKFALKELLKHSI